MRELEQLCPKSLLDLRRTIASALFEKKQYAWKALPEIGDFIRSVGPSLDGALYERLEGDVYIARDVKRYPNVVIEGPCIIGSRTQLRPGAFLRGNVVVGCGSVVGNSTELKNVVLFDEVQVPHYNYVGDSVLGYRAHMGAGSITSNVKSDKTLVCVRINGQSIATGLKKCGAILGDGVEIGCGSVLNPGTVIGRGAQIYPLSSVRGFVPGGTIYKRAGEIIQKHSGEGDV